MLHLPLPAIREIVAADPGAWRFFGLASIAHNDMAIGAADDLLIRDHVKRSIAVLLRLGGCRYLTPQSAQPIEVDVSQEDFATMTNTARTTAGGVLRALEASGAVRVTYRRVSILAPDRLRAMLEADAEGDAAGAPPPSRVSPGYRRSISFTWEQPPLTDHPAFAADRAAVITGAASGIGLAAASDSPASA